MFFDVVGTTESPGETFGELPEPPELIIATAKPTTSTSAAVMARTRRARSLPPEPEEEAGGRFPPEGGEPGMRGGGWPPDGAGDGLAPPPIPMPSLGGRGTRESPQMGRSDGICPKKKINLHLFEPDQPDLLHK